MQLLAVLIIKLVKLLVSLVAYISTRIREKYALT